MPTASATSSSSSTPSSSSILVLDHGAHSLRLSSPSTDASPPILSLPNLLARSRSSRTLLLPSSLPQCSDYTSLHLRTPHQRGHIVDFPALKLVWDDAFSHLVPTPPPPANANAKDQVKPLQHKTLLLSHPYFDLPQTREALETLLFQEYGVESLAWFTTAELAIWADTNAPPPTPAPASSSSPIQDLRSKSRSSRSRPRARPSTAPKPRHPECTLVIDLGYSSTHVVPIISRLPYSAAIRRLDIGGKMLTNLLKETLSFRQWDLMDETYLVNVIKEKCCFVAPEAGPPPGCGQGRLGRWEDVKKAMQAKRPSQWSFAELVEEAKYGNGRCRVVWRLPDGGEGGEMGGVGEVVHGPSKCRARSRDGLKRSKEGEDNDDDQDDEQDDDDFIACPNDEATKALASTGGKRKRSSSSSSSSSSSRIPTSHPIPGSTDPTLTLETERFQTLEPLFYPPMIGLDQASLPDIVRESIAACPLEAQGVLWSNILVVGGGARCPGLVRRVENELRARAPDEVGVGVRSFRRPDLTPIHGGAILASYPPSSPEGKWWRSRLVFNPLTASGGGGGGGGRKR
ncbi:Actin-related protein 6 [Thecaphora frezii]